MGTRDNNVGYARYGGRQLQGDYRQRERETCGCENRSTCEGTSNRWGSAYRQETGRRYVEREGGCGCGNNRSVEREGGCGCGNNRSVGREGSCGCGNTRVVEREGDCGCGRRSDVPARRNCGECDALMQRLQKLDFSIQETVLYLDAYPDCCEAKAYYHQLVKERCEVAKEYEENCGPLKAMGNVSTTTWQWVEAPWPWHLGFPGNKA